MNKSYDSPHEPKWTQNIPDKLICNYYFYISVAILLLGILSIIMHGYILYGMPSKYRVPIIASLLLSVIQFGVVYYIYLFAYVLCSRTLLDKKKV
jgi:hypothetical protein